MSLQVYPIDMLHVQDDWNWLLRDEANDLTAVVDPSEAKGVSAARLHPQYAPSLGSYRW